MKLVWLMATALILFSSAAAFAGSWPAQMDPRLVEALAAAPGVAEEFLIFLEERADLSGAATLRTKEEKGAFVYQALTGTAERTQAALREKLRGAGASFTSFWIDNAILTRGDETLARELAARPDVRWIAANTWVNAGLPQPTAGVSVLDQPLGPEWNVNKINATGVWARGVTGQGVVVGGHDTGYDWDHPALKSQYRGWNGTIADHNYCWHDAIHGGGGSCGPDSPEPCDDYGHGTHTMGTLVGDDGAGNRVGVAPGARWIGARNMNVGNGSVATYVECFQWFVAPTDLDGANPDPAMAPDVINNSWECTASEGCTDVAVLTGVVAAARAAGIVVVVSAGNRGSSCGTVSTPPAIYEDSFTVGNTDSSDNIASDSGRGPVTVDGSGRMKPDVSAPGSNIRSTVPGTGYGTMSGASMASPHVAGTVALVLSAHPRLRGRVDLVEKLIRRTAVPRTTAQECGGVPGSEVPNNTYGWGRIDAYRAVGLDDDDGDGMPNWWEIVFDLDPEDAHDRDADADGDGMSNWQEFAANTDPRDGESLLALKDVRLRGTSGIVVSWSSSPDGLDTNRTYNLHRTTRLGLGAPWVCVASDLPSTGSTTFFTNDVDRASASNLFYRVGIVGADNTVFSAPRKPVARSARPTARRRPERRQPLAGPAQLPVPAGSTCTSFAPRP